MTWISETPPPWPPLRLALWPRIVLRLTLLVMLLMLGVALLLPARLIERLLFGPRRPLSAEVTRRTCRLALVLMRLSLRIEGRPLRGRGALVANHASWLDIFALNAAVRVCFVSKAEVASWPVIGWLARATGTVFIRRDRREAAQHTRVLQERLQAGDRLLFFPEGTSSDSLRVLPFKSTLFEAFLVPELRDFLMLQPVTVSYHVPQGHDLRALAWWGDMDFAGHLLRLLAMPRAGQVTLIFHPPLALRDIHDRKALARSCETTIREGFERVRGG